MATNHIDLGLTLNNLGVFYKSQRRLAEAAAVHGRALNILKRALDPSHPKLTICRENYARLLHELNGSTANRSVLS